MSALPDSLAPANVEAEQAVLGSILIDPAAIMRIVATLRSEDFSRPGHAAIFAAMQSLYSRRQAIDLVTRKLAPNGGASVFALLDELDTIIRQVEASNDPAFGTTGAKLREALDSLTRASRWLLARVGSAPNDALAGATPYLRLFGSTLGGCYLAAEALAARGENPDNHERYVTLARFFAENVTVQAPSLEKSVTDGADAVNGADAVLLG